MHQSKSGRCSVPSLSKKGRDTNGFVLMKHFVYILQSKDGAYYTGMTKYLQDRLRRHNRRRGAKFTKGKGVMQLVYSEEHSSLAAAMKREKQIKDYSRKKKSALVRSFSWISETGA